MSNINLFWKKLALAVIPLAFAIFAILYPNLPEQKLDNSILFLVLLVVLIIVLPWERLTSLKAAGIEFELDRPLINKAISDLEVLKGKENINDEKIRKLFERLVSNIEQAKGSRILWIDDSPKNVFGERRLLRALNIETVMANSSEMAQSCLDTDGDFDLIISDMRRGESIKKGRDDMPEGVQFIKRLRETETRRSQISRYSHIPSLPVIFYSGKAYNEMLRLTEPIRQDGSVIILATGVEKLFEEVIRTLSYVRSEPIQIIVGPTSELPAKDK
jgi:CheY-like chemotaxis protein